MNQESIYRWFISSHKSGRHPINGLPDATPAWYYRERGACGVMIELRDDSIDLDLPFSNVRLYTKRLEVEGEEEKPYLILSCEPGGEDYLRKFSVICEDFIIPGINGERRKTILDNPMEWWSEWKKLIGNVNVDNSTYSLLGELIAYDHMLIVGEEPDWEGGDFNTVDIRGKKIDCEVKSTVIRNTKNISISSMHQLNSGVNELHLYLCCFERSDRGVSVNDMLSVLESHGADIDAAEGRLKRQGYPRRSYERDIKYRLLSFDDYLIDDSFPKIIPKSFKGDTLPPGIDSITYVVSLAGLKCTPVNYLWPPQSK